MMKAKWVAAAALLSMSAGALADGDYQYESVTKIASNTTFYGVLVGDTAPTTLGYQVITSTCIDWIELMLKHPGQYLLTVTATSQSPGGTPVTSISSCTVEVKP